MIRRLGPDDLSHWKMIRHAALKQSPHTYGRTMASFLAQPDQEHIARLGNTAVFAAFHNDQIVGSAAWHVYGFEVERHRGKLQSVYVAPDARGTGVIDKLLQAVVDDSLNHVLQLELDVGTTNAPAIACYLRHGFQIVGTLPRALCHDGEYIDEHLMLRRLDA